MDSNANPRVNCAVQLLLESSMHYNYFAHYRGFTSILKRKLPLKFSMLDVKFHGTKNPCHHVRNFFSAVTLKGIYKDIFPIIFPQTFDKDVKRWHKLLIHERS